MKITNKSIEVGPIEELNENHYLFNYSKVYQGTNMDVVIEIEDENITDLSANSSCGCTEPVVSLEDENTIKLTIKYNSDLLGEFYKRVTVFYKSGKGNKSLQIDIEGNVITKN